VPQPPGGTCATSWTNCSTATWPRPPRCWWCSRRHRTTRMTTTARPGRAPAAPLCAAGGLPGVPRRPLVLRSANAPAADGRPARRFRGSPRSSWTGATGGCSPPRRRKRRAGLRRRAAASRDRHPVGADARHAVPMAVALPLLALAVGGRCAAALLPLRTLGQPLAQRDRRRRCSRWRCRAPAELVPMLDALNGLFTASADLLRPSAASPPTPRTSCARRSPPSAPRPRWRWPRPTPRRARTRCKPRWQGCDRATRLVEQLLTLSRLEAGEKLAAAPVDLATLARQVVAEAGAPALAKAAAAGAGRRPACLGAGRR
jgi:hypothetical protein